MKYAIIAIAICVPMLTGCFNDEPRIIQVQVPVPVPATPMPVAAPAQITQVAQPPKEEEPRVVQVLSATPNYRETQVPRQQCRTDSVPVEYEEEVPVTQQVQNDEPRRPSIGGAMLGGVLGAALGHQVGNGSGRQLATGVGLIAGTAAGSHWGGEAQPSTRTVTIMQRQTRTRYEQQQHCETVNETFQELDGYTVTFNYKGQLVSSVMSRNPGAFLVLGVDGNTGR